MILRRCVVVGTVLLVQICAASAEDEVPSCDRGDTCCVRTFSVLPFETPEGQEDDKSKGLASALMGRPSKGGRGLLDPSEQGCPIACDFISLEGREELNRMIDAIIRIEGGGEPDPEALEDREQLGDFDYVFVGSVTADEITGKTERTQDQEDGTWFGGDLIGTFTAHVKLVDHHRGAVLKEGEATWAGVFYEYASHLEEGDHIWGGIGRVEPMVDLAATFKPLDDLVYDYERIPETCIVDPNENDVEAGTQTTILIRDIVDLQGRSSAPFQRIMVEAKKGSILNGEPVAHMRVFEVGEGPVQISYRARSECVDQTDTIIVHNSCESNGPLASTTSCKEIGRGSVEITCTPKWAWVGSLVMEQRWRFNCEATRQKGNDSQTLEQHDLTRVMVSMELEIDDIRVAEEGLDIKNDADIQRSGTVKELTTNSKDVWSRNSASWIHRRYTARGNATCGVGETDKERMSISLTGGGLTRTDEIRSLMNEMRSTTDQNRIAELNEQLLELMEPDGESGSLPLKIIVQYAPECTYRLMRKSLSEREDQNGHEVTEDKTFHTDIHVLGIQIPGSGEIPFAGTYEKDDDGVERIHGEFSGVVDRSSSGTTWDCPEGTLFQSGELDLTRQRIR